MQIPVTFGQWTPDHAPHSTEGLVTASGVYAAANAYKPVMAFQEIAEALPGGFSGAASYAASDGTARVIAGDSSALYTLSGGAWTAASTGYTVNNRWRFTQFGDDVICVYGGTPVRFSLVAGTAAALTGSPPTGDLICTSRDFVVIARADGANNVVQWCAQGDAANWTIGFNQAGLQPLYSGGKIMGLAGGEYVLIIQRYSIKRMSYTGDAADPWQFDEISTNYGCLSEGSVCQAGRMVFFLSDRGFVMCDGNEVKPIGAERVNLAFRDAYSSTDLANMWATIDPIRSLAIWAMPNKLWMYNWELDRWTIAEIPCQAAFSSFSEAVSIDQMDALYGNLDAIPYSLDDPRFSGGEPRITVVHYDGRFGVLSGDNIAATLELPLVEYAADREARINNIRPVTDATTGLTMTVDSRRRLGDAPNTETYTQINDFGDMPVRVAGQSVGIKLDWAAGSDWTFAQGVEVFARQGGRKRG